MPRKRSAPADLSELDKAVAVQEEGIVIPILHMDGTSPLGFGIRVAGPDSERAIKARQIMSMEAIERESLEPLTSDERFVQGTKYLARISISFDGQAKLDGKVLGNTEEDFVKLYRRFRFIREQVDRGAAGREGFLLASETPSSAPSVPSSESRS